MKIATTHVVSSNINRIGYHGSTLYIGFNSGQAYAYAGVPYWTYLEMLKAESAGRFFYTKIRGAFTYEKCLTDPFNEQAKDPSNIE